MNLITGTYSMDNKGNLFFKRVRRKFVILSIQALIVIIAFLISFLLRFDAQIPERYLSLMILLLPVLVVTKILVFGSMGLSSGWWRYVSLPDLVVILKANFFASLAFLVPVIYFWHIIYFPRSIILLDFILCFLMISGVRVLTRFFREYWDFNIKERDSTRQNVVIVGAGAVGQTIVREIHQNPHLKQHIVGFVDFDPQRQHQRFQGIPVLGKPDTLKRIFLEHRIEQVIIAQPAACPRELRSIVDTCTKAGVKSKILPAMGDIINGGVSVQHMRDVELEDLLGREPARLNIQEIQQYLAGKRILVTGAGGSIGSEICRQVAAFAPEFVVLLENAETPLFNVENELKGRFPRQVFHACIGDIRDRSRIERVFSEFRPHILFHAAAYKHVPMSEHNPVEVIKNNIFGTRILAETAHSWGAEHFVMISTDKAVNPANVMGASKRAAEIFIQNLAGRSPTRFVTVRFGNVLGSNGSVIPIFKEQIKKGGPVTVTHPAVTRYFMTIPEAVQLVLQAGSMGKGGEIFILDMGKPVNIVRLAEEMIRLSGFRAYEDIDIVFTGLRPGEKLYEELLKIGENVLTTSHEKIRVARAIPYDTDLLARQLGTLEEALSKNDRMGVMKTLTEMVPEYHPVPGGTEKTNTRFKPSTPIMKKTLVPAFGGNKRSG
jgi:FlaA1/EpsC-like NDP-sugar epimerase